MGLRHRLRIGLLALLTAGFAATAQAGDGSPPRRLALGDMAAAAQAERAGRLDRAALGYRRAHAADPAAVQPLLALGRLAARLGEAEAAAELFRSAEAVAPGDREARRGLGDALIDLQRAADALAVFDRLLTEEPADARAWNGRALALDLLGDHDAARLAYDRGLALAPGDAELAANVSPPSRPPGAPALELAFNAARGAGGTDGSAVPVR